MGLKKASACFLAVEKQALEDGLFVDYEVNAATTAYSAVTCTVSEKKGTRRIIRMASDKDLSVAQECAGYMALCAYYEKDMADMEKKAPSAAPNISQNQKENHAGRQDNRAEKTGQQQRQQGQDGMQQGKTVPGGTNANSSATPSNSAAAQTSPTSQNRAEDDFRVPISNYKNRSDNWISDMVKTKEGRKVIAMLCDVAKPNDNVKGLVAAAKSYVQRHQINLRE